MQIGPDAFVRGFCAEPLARPLLGPVGRPIIVLLLDRALGRRGSWKPVSTSHYALIEESGLLSQATILQGYAL